MAKLAFSQNVNLWLNNIAKWFIVDSFFLKIELFLLHTK